MISNLIQHVNNRRPVSTLLDLVRRVSMTQNNKNAKFKSQQICNGVQNNDTPYIKGVSKHLPTCYEHKVTSVSPDRD